VALSLRRGDLGSFGAAAQLHAVTYSSLGRVPVPTYLFMKATGGNAFRTVKMIFPVGAMTEGVADEPTFVEALREFGMATDADFIDEPLNRHRRVWTNDRPRVLQERWARFQDIREEVLEIAYASSSVTTEFALDAGHGAGERT